MMTLERWFDARLSEFLRRTGVSPTTFGVRALGDPNFVREVRAGRSPTLRTADRALAYMYGPERDPVRPGRSLRPGRGRGRSRSARRRGSTPATRLLRLPEVQSRTGLSRTAIYQRRLAGRFPRAVPLGTRCVGWIESEIDEWVRERIAERRGGPNAPPSEPGTEENEE